MLINVSQHRNIHITKFVIDQLWIQYGNKQLNLTPTNLIKNDSSNVHFFLSVGWSPCLPLGTNCHKGQSNPIATKENQNMVWCKYIFSNITKLELGKLCTQCLCMLVLCNKKLYFFFFIVMLFISATLTIIALKARFKLWAAHGVPNIWS